MSFFIGLGLVLALFLHPPQNLAMAGRALLILSVLILDMQTKKIGEDLGVMLVVFAVVA